MSDQLIGGGVIGAGDESPVPGVEEQPSLETSLSGSDLIDPFELLEIRPEDVVLGDGIDPAEAEKLREGAINDRTRELKEEIAPVVAGLEAKVEKLKSGLEELTRSRQDLEIQRSNLQGDRSLRGVLARGEDVGSEPADVQEGETLQGDMDGDGDDAESVESTGLSLEMPKPRSYLIGAMPPEYKFTYDSTAFSRGLNQIAEDFGPEVRNLEEDAVAMIAGLSPQAKSDIRILYWTVLRMCCDDSENPDLPEGAREAVFGLTDLESGSPEMLSNYKEFLAHGLMKI